MAVALVTPAVALNNFVVDANNMRETGDVRGPFQDAIDWDINLDELAVQSNVATQDIIGVLVVEDMPFSDNSMVYAVLPGEGVEVSNDNTFGNQFQEDIVFTDAMCDEDFETLEFTITNLGDKEWDFTQEEEWLPTNDIWPVRIFWNQYEVNRDEPYLEQGATQFFDSNENFIDRCTGLDEGMLAPGESATCDFENIPVTPTFVGHTLRLDSPESTETLTVRCV